MKIDSIPMPIITESTPTSLTLSWNKPDNVNPDGYTIYLNKDYYTFN